MLTAAKSANIRRLGIFATGTSGFTGEGQPSLYTNKNGTYVDSDFVWSVQLAQWNLKQGNGCPTSTTATKKSYGPAKKKAAKPAEPATGTTGH